MVRLVGVPNCLAYSVGGPAGCALGCSRSGRREDRWRAQMDFTIFVAGGLLIVVGATWTLDLQRGPDLLGGPRRRSAGSAVSGRCSGWRRVSAAEPLAHGHDARDVHAGRIHAGGRRRHDGRIRPRLRRRRVVSAAGATSERPRPLPRPIGDPMQAIRKFAEPARPRLHGRLVGLGAPRFGTARGNAEVRGTTSCGGSTGSYLRHTTYGFAATGTQLREGIRGERWRADPRSGVRRDRQPR